jgi:hypothetical protein
MPPVSVGSKSLILERLFYMSSLDEHGPCVGRMKTGVHSWGLGKVEEV